jgi:pimeloyl-ACP methyl ester carboxylesterase
MDLTRRTAFALLAAGAGATLLGGGRSQAEAAEFHGLMPLRTDLDWETRTFAAKDGTKLIYRVMGQGRPLVVLHGGASNAQAYYDVALRLRDRFKMYLLERRNYGVSGDGPASYTLEGEDAHGLLDIAGPGASLFGHSAGALVGLCAGLDHRGISRLVLYEPPLLTAGERIKPIMANYKAKVASGALHDAIAESFQHITGDTPQNTSALADRFLALDPASRARMLTILETEMIQLIKLDPDPAHYRDIARPVTFLTGDKSAEVPLQSSVAALHAAIPDSKVITFPGQGHVANMTAPQMFVDGLVSALA